MTKGRKESIQEATKGDLVQVHRVVLRPDQRAENLPESTKAVCYEAWIKGFLLNDKAKIGDTVQIETFAGRELSGTLEVVNPTYEHNFGRPRPELLRIGIEVKKQMRR
jgi:hypothetical protein